MRHLDDLTARFGERRVLGGDCMISAALDESGRVLHLNEAHTLVFGELDGSRSARFEAIASTFSEAGFISRPTEHILQDMWEKWVFISACAGITCLMRAPIGDIVAAGAADLATSLLDECAAIAASEGFPPGVGFLERTRQAFEAPGSLLAASMLRDIERGAPVEADHILGDLLRRSRTPATHSLLRIAHAHVKAYEAGRQRSRA
jgi:2-dehydropantoate 2-reductase